MGIRRINNIKSGQRKSPQLYPGGSSKIGFLQKGQDFNYVVERDRQALALMGVDLDYILFLLDHFFDAVQHSRSQNRSQREMRYTAPNGNTYRLDITPSMYMGWQECPICLDGNAAFSYVTRTGTKISGGFNQVRFRNIAISDLLPHLVQKHGFFQGGSFRTAPEDIVQLLGEEKIPGGIARARELPLTSADVRHHD